MPPNTAPTASLAELAHQPADGLRQKASRGAEGAPDTPAGRPIAKLVGAAERQETLDRLRASEERFRLLVEQAPEAILIFDYDQSRYIDANHKAEVLFGCPRQEIVKHRALDFYTDAQPDGQPLPRTYTAHLEQALRGESVVFERRIVSASGEERICEVTLIELPSMSGRLLRASFIDITEQKRAMQDLAFERAILATEHDLSPDGILVVDRDNGIISANRRFGELFDIPPSLLAHKASDQVLAWVTGKIADPDAFLRRIHHLMGHFNETSSEEIPLKDGRIIYRYSSPTMLNDGKAVGRVWFFRDITELKQAECRLRRANRALRTLSSGSEVLVHTASEAELLNQMCRTIVETGGYRMAWIGVPQPDANKSVRLVACAGKGTKAFARQMRLSWADVPNGRGTTGRAIRTGEPQTAQDFATDPHASPWRAITRAYGIGSCASLPLNTGDRASAVLAIYATETNAFDDEELALLRELADDLSYGVRALRNRAEHEALNQRWRASLEATVGAIASTVELRDPYTAGHQQRVAQLAVAIATDLGLPPPDIHGIHLAGIVHDVGKINIPAEILNKPGKLTALEFALIQGHVEAGYEILRGVDFPWPIAEIVREHHERLDGSGYPQGLTGDQMLRQSKILAVADVVEAMMSHRPYRPALGAETALAEVERGKGRLYDPDAVEACQKLFRDKLFKFE